ncbi:hypothetical protein FJT64_021201 [Amphibalanus amphitrite]|uniref:Uncharacterized protein n=1 Tax=Amphibalanus amphitrite TaxID=1232801 RepID=A0A6A4WJB0_AMPAM|nr:hypothetical protein FJT64_021201 [Amphibalanus amphitrite]
MYREVDEVIAAAAIGTLLWYLTGGLVPLALFSTKVPEEERRSLVDAILNCKPDDVPASAHQQRFGTGFGKPRFMALAPTTSLADLANRATAARSERHLQDVLQTVEEDRLKQPDLRNSKRKLSTTE